MRRIRTRPVVLAVAAASLVAALALPTLASDSDTATGRASDRVTDRVTDDAEAADHPRGRRAAHRAEARELLAAELGITVDELEAAIGRVRARLRADRLDELEERLAGRVEAGDLTEAEADTLLDLVERGALRPRGLGRHGRGW